MSGIFSKDSDLLECYTVFISKQLKTFGKSTMPLLARLDPEHNSIILSNISYYFLTE
jgi:hypothetical protein